VKGNKEPFVDHPNQRDGATVIPFPQLARLRRERILDVAEKAIPLLEAARASGNSTLLRGLFAVLGDVAWDIDATELLETISTHDGEIVALPDRRGPS
jgi:hypothetical protein